MPWPWWMLTGACLIASCHYLAFPSCSVSSLDFLLFSTSRREKPTALAGSKGFNVALLEMMPWRRGKRKTNTTRIKSNGLLRGKKIFKLIYIMPWFVPSCTVTYLGTYLACLIGRPTPGVPARSSPVRAFRWRPGTESGPRSCRLVGAAKTQVATGFFYWTQSQRCIPFGKT